MTHTIKVNVYPHSALLNMAYYSVSTIKSKLNAGDREALNLDGANCTIALAFTVEGILNAVGHKLIENWKEKQPYRVKLKECLNALEIEELDKDPFTTLNTLKEIRDEIAHPKPSEKTIEISGIDEVWEHHNTKWQNICTPEFAIHAFEQVKEFELMVLENEAIAVTTFQTGSSIVSIPIAF